MMKEEKTLSSAPTPSRRGADRAAARIVEPATTAPTAELSRVADAFFDERAFEQSRASAERETPAAIQRILTAAPAPGAERLLGLLGQCMIPGCDVHFVSIEQDVLMHLPVTAETPSEFDQARAYWRAPDSGAVAVLVYEEHMEVLWVDGSVRPFMRPSR